MAHGDEPDGAAPERLEERDFIARQTEDYRDALLLQAFHQKRGSVHG
jgi:hypothetical protein